MDDPRSSRRTSAQQAGDAAEAMAAEHLAGIGWTVLQRNVRIGRKEVDIVALDPGPPSAVVLVEVRWRARRDFGLAEETFGWQKRRHLRGAIGRLLETGSLPDGFALAGRAIRVDLIVVEPRPSRAARTGPAPRTTPDPGVRIRHHRDALAG